MTPRMKPKIYCWVNSGRGTDWQVVMAMAEDGHCLASHVSSCEAWAKHDIGYSSKWKHEAYAKHYPDGYELEWVDDARNHAGLDAAYAKNQAMRPPEPTPVQSAADEVKP